MLFHTANQFFDISQDVTTDSTTSCTSLKASSARGPLDVTCKLALHDIPALQLDEKKNWLRPLYPRYKSELAPAKPMLAVSLDDIVEEILPSEKPNRRISFDETVSVMEIESNFQMLLLDEQVEDDDDVSYDYDNYFENPDGENAYECDTDDYNNSYSLDYSYDSSYDSSTELEDPTTTTPIQFDIDGMKTPNLNDSIIRDVSKSSGLEEKYDISDTREPNDRVINKVVDLGEHDTPAALVIAEATARGSRATRMPVSQEETENIQASRNERDVYSSYNGLPTSSVRTKYPSSHPSCPICLILKDNPSSIMIGSKLCPAA